jgi:hypothetical protein
MGFALPDELLRPRCALTAPFHPYRRFEREAQAGGGIFSVALSVKPALSESPRPLAGMLPCGDRTFLPIGGKTAFRATTRPARPGLIVAESLGHFAFFFALAFSAAGSVSDANWLIFTTSPPGNAARSSNVPPIALT